MFTEEKVRTECVKFIIDAKDSKIHEDQKEQMRQNQDFFRGGKHQWTEEEYNVYKSKGVEPVTINRSKPVIKGLMGMYLNNRQEIKVRPRNNGTQSIARVWTEILKHLQDNSYANFVYASAYFRGCIDTESYLKLEIDRTENINGQPKIYCRTINDILVDRNAAEYDLNESAKYIIERIWQDKDELKAEYPDREEGIDEAIETELGSDSIQDRINGIANYMSGESDTDHYEDEDDILQDYEKLKEYRYLKHVVYWKECVPGIILVDKQSEQMHKITDEKKIKKLRRKVSKSKRFELINYAAKTLHETHILGNHLLKDVKNPFGENISVYPIVRFAPIWDEGFACGALDDVISLNKEENIHRTQSIRLLNQTANSGWIVGTDNNKEYISLLKDFGSVEGIVLPRDKFGNVLEKIQPNTPSPGHYAMAQQFELDVKRVSGVDDAVLGYDTGRTESGVAIGRKQAGSVSTNSIYTDNFYRSLEIFGNMMLSVVIENDFYSDTEIMEIVGESGMLDVQLMEKAKNNFVSKINNTELREPPILQPPNPETMMMVKPEDRVMFMETVRNGIEDAAKYQKMYPGLKQTWDSVIKFHATQMLLMELKNDRKGKYGVKVTISSSAPTERLSRLAELETVQDKYGIIPPDIFIDATDLANKEEIKARMQQQAQMAGVANG